MATPAPDLTQHLNAAAAGDAAAQARLLPLIYDELQRMARDQMAREGAHHTLQPTALVHEAWLRLGGVADETCADCKDIRWEHRGHFFGAAAQAMRRILVDRARMRQSQKRDSGRHADVPLDDILQFEPDPDLVLDLDRALATLEDKNERQARVVLLRFYGGLSVPETAAALGVSVGSIERDWRLARARLLRELDRDAI